MHPFPPNSINLHPAPPSSFQPPSTQLYPPPPSSFQPPPSSLQHPKQYLKQNIAYNWTISPNLGQKIECCPFWLKIGTPDILEVLIQNPELDFWNSDPKIHFWAKMFQGCLSIWRMLILNPDFWANLDPKSQNCLFCLKIGTHGISRMLILIATLVFWISNPNFLFGQICMPTVWKH